MNTTYPPVFISGPHGGGKSTLVEKLKSSANLFLENDFDIDFTIDFPSLANILSAMKALRSFRRLALPLAGLALSFVLIAGCATAKFDWDSRIGNYSYDQAVLELGPPDRLAPLSDGSKVGEWLTQRGYAQGSFSAGGSYHYGGGPWFHHYQETPSPDHFVRLTFGPDGKLKDWRKVMK